MRLWDEDPDMMSERYADKSEWQQQVTYAQQELDTGLEYAIEEKIQEVETKLHDGQLYDERETAPSEVTGQSLNYPKRDPTMPDWWYKEQIAKGKWKD